MYPVTLAQTTKSNVLTLWLKLVGGEFDPLTVRVN